MSQIEAIQQLMRELREELDLTSVNVYLTFGTKSWVADAHTYPVDHVRYFGAFATGPSGFVAVYRRMPRNERAWDHVTKDLLPDEVRTKFERIHQALLVLA